MTEALTILGILALITVGATLALVCLIHGTDKNGN